MKRKTVRGTRRRVEPDVFHLTDYRQLLNRELEARRGRNSRYSLRAYARDLKIVPHRLSEILRGKAGLSRRTAAPLAARLGWETTEIAYFLDLVEAAHARSPKAREEAASRAARARHIRRHHAIEADAFRVIADWYHFAILELLKLDRFRFDLDWMSTALGISKQELTFALERLARLGILSVQDDKIQLVQVDNCVPGTPDASAIRAHHQQILRKAWAALRTKDGDSEFSSTQLSIRRENLPEARRLIRAFWRDFERLMDEPAKKDDVYCLSIQFFGLLQKEI